MQPPVVRQAEVPTPTPGLGVEQDSGVVRADRAERDARLAELLRATAQGDCRAFEAFFDATAAMARVVARRVLRGDDVDELLSDAYFEAWRHAARFDVQRGSAVTWLLTIVHSRALDQWRRLVARPEVEAGDDLAEAAAGQGSDPIEALWQRQAQASLNLALATLNASERWVLGLAYFRDLSHAEIARCTGLPLGSVKSLLLRSQAKLRQRLGGNAPA
jgi:RNA polymerase sigma-70 factor (ECF subfamily)